MRAASGDAGEESTTRSAGSSGGAWSSGTDCRASASRRPLPSVSVGTGGSPGGTTIRNTLCAASASSRSRCAIIAWAIAETERKRFARSFASTRVMKSST
jgi:hypothetical protein